MKKASKRDVTDVVTLMGRCVLIHVQISVECVVMEFVNTIYGFVNVKWRHDERVLVFCA